MHVKNVIKRIQEEKHPQNTLVVQMWQPDSCPSEGYFVDESKRTKIVPLTKEEAEKYYKDHPNNEEVKNFDE
jgi:hypothetical protein